MARGELTVATLNGHTTYFEGANSPAGFAYHLARAFADYWCADLRVLGPSDHTRAFPMVARGETDVAVGFSITELRADEFWFGPPYQRVTQQLLYRERQAGDDR